MIQLRSGRGRLILSIIIVGVVAGTTFAVLSLSGVTFREQQPLSAVGSQATPTPRDRLAICVDAIAFDSEGAPVDGDPAVESAAKLAVEAAIPLVSSHPFFSDAYGTNPPLAEIGCPSLPAPLQDPGTRWYSGIPDFIDGGGGPLVLRRSYYSVFAYVVPSEQDIDRLLGGSKRRVAVQEFECSGSGPGGTPCAEQTTAIYVTPNELQDVHMLERLILDAAGLAGL